MTDTPFRTPAQKPRRALGDISNHKSQISSAKALIDFQVEAEEVLGYAHSACFDYSLIDRFDDDALAEIAEENLGGLANPDPTPMIEEEVSDLEISIEEDVEFDAIAKEVEHYMYSFDFKL